MTHVPLNRLPEFAGNVLATIWMRGATKRATIIALSGELGAGKTTFIQALAKKIGVIDIVQSPTYVLMKNYELPGPLTSFGSPRRFKKFIHIDAYRLERPEQFAQLKPETFLNDPSVIVAIEWPERVAGFLPEPDLTLNFSSDGVETNERNIEVK